MGKSRNYDKESRLIDRLKHENANLKRENAKLRRLNDRHVADIQNRVQKAETEPKKKKSKDWTCDECGKGTMKFLLFSRHDGDFYFRSCDLPGCGHRTRLKKYTKDVEES